VTRHRDGVRREALRQHRQVLAETIMRITGIGDADHEQVVALACFASHRLGIESRVGDNVGFERSALVAISFQRAAVLAALFTASSTSAPSGFAPLSLAFSRFAAPLCLAWRSLSLALPVRSRTVVGLV
jgi:hypothetical protein